MGEVGAETEITPTPPAAACACCTCSVRGVIVSSAAAQAQVTSFFQVAPASGRGQWTVMVALDGRISVTTNGDSEEEALHGAYCELLERGLVKP